MAGTNALSREKIFEIAQSLPPAPKVLVGLGELLKDLNVGLDRVAELIKRDTALAAHLIRISNSVVYGGSGEVKVGTVEEAVNRVGFREVYRLVGLATAARLTDRALKFYNVPTEPLRANMLYTALVCEALAQECGFDARLAYTAGLMRTLGILVLDRVAELLTGVEPYNHEALGSYAMWEGRVFLFSNCDVADMILAEWGFPTETTEAVRDHYLLREADYENRLACLLNLAGGIVAAAGNALPGEYVYWEATPRKLQILNLTTRKISKASERARAAFEAFRTHVDLGPQQPCKAEPTPEESFNSEKSAGVSSANTEPQTQTNPALAARQALPWWRLSFAYWPPVAKAVFLALAIALAAGVTLAGSVGYANLPPVPRELTASLSQIRMAAAFVNDLCATLSHSIPALWLFGAAAFLATLYTALFGLGASAYRTLVLNR